jgi:hypothetical protein
MRLTLAIPHLLVLDSATLNAAPALARVAGLAEAPNVEINGIDRALLTATHARANTPMAPLAALGAGFDPGARYVLRADPLALVAGRDDVLLRGRIDDLTRDDADALIAMLNDHFRDDGLVFHAPRPDAWFVTTADEQRLDTTPLPAVHGATYPHQPRGEDAKKWRQWQSEIQMLLHGHPVNAVRESSGQPLVTGVWIWGGGRVADTPSQWDETSFAAPGPAGDVLRGLATRAGTPCLPPPHDYAALPTTEAAVVMLPPLTAADGFEKLARDWLEPTVAALGRGTLASLRLLADDGSRAYTWNARHPTLLARIRSRFAKGAFAPASTLGDFG